MYDEQAGFRLPDHCYAWFAPGRMGPRIYEMAGKSPAGPDQPRGEEMIDV